MSLLNKLRHVLAEPPPEWVFEFSEAGLAWAHHGKTETSGFEALEPGVISVNPVRDNVLLPEQLQETVHKLVPASANKRRRPAAVILPDYCCRVAVLDFDTFPSDPQEQLSLVRFRVKKSVPFDLEAASVSFHEQPHPAGGEEEDIVVAVVSLEILARYEAPLRQAGLHPGVVTISALTMLQMHQSASLEVVAKLCGKAMSIAVTEGNNLRMFRCVELETVSPEEVAAVLFPTYAFVEDEWKRRPERLLLCGFGGLGGDVAQALEAELNTRVEPLRGAHGTPGPFNAGLMGYLQGMGMEVAA